MIIAGLFLALCTAGVAYLWELPFPQPAARPQATVVYDANGQILATFSEQYRMDVPLSRVPQVVIDAVVSTEDRNFFHEGGVDPIAIGRAVIADMTGKKLQGGSTITQQYVKNLYLSPKRSLLRKIKEAVFSIRLANQESKHKILEGYLNTIYWGRGAYGVAAAARVYFGEDVTKLTLREASLLAALIKDPGTADPMINPELARSQQAETLHALVRDHKITPAQAASVEHQPYASYVLPPPDQIGAQAAGSSGNNYFIAAVRQQLYAKYGTRMVDTGGLKVTTSLDPVLQRQAYQAVYGQGGLNPGQGDPSGALVSIDDQGRVKALVGGQDYSRSAVDLALGRAGGGTGRQAGSTFKAFMLAAVIKAGYTVQSTFPAPPKVVVPNGTGTGKDWTVTNYQGETFPPSMNLIDATADSVNTVYAQVVARLGVHELDSMAESMGIDPAELRGAYDSQVLGSADVSPIEMAAAYATLADGGVYHAPLLVTSVTGPNGNRMALPTAASSRRVLTSRQAAIETYVLRQVVTTGTGTAAGHVSSPVAGKTGTTQHAGDAWFIGYTPKLTTATWMGYANSDKSMDGFRGVPAVAGGTFPAQIWHSFMSAALRSHPAYAGPLPATPPLTGKVLNPLPLHGDLVVLTETPSTPLPGPAGTIQSARPSSTTTSTVVPSTTARRPTSTTLPASTTPPSSSTTVKPTTTTEPTNTTTTVAPTTTTDPPPSTSTTGASTSATTAGTSATSG